jgi:DNA polymerase V
VQDLKVAHAPTLRSRFGVVMEKTQRELQEVPCIEIQEIQPDKKQIISSRSFGQSVTDVNVLKDAMSMFVANACAKLRAQNSQAALIQVFLLTNRHREDQPQYSPSITVPLPYGTNDSLEVSRWVDHLVGKIFKPGYKYKKAGIMLSEITPVSQRQGDLLEPTTTSNARLMTALDGLNKRYGRGTVKVSTQGAYKQWQMKQERKSPSYTTDWYSIPVV